MEYDDYKEQPTTAEFVLIMVVCGILCIFGYLVGKAVMIIIGGG